MRDFLVFHHADDLVIERSQPEEFGSHRSPLVQVLLSEGLHNTESPLTRDEWITLVTWVDANAPYYDFFRNKRSGAGRRSAGDLEERQVTARRTWWGSRLVLVLRPHDVP